MRSYGGRRPAVRPARPGKREANKSPLSAADDGTGAAQRFLPPSPRGAAWFGQMWLDLLQKLVAARSAGLDFPTIWRTILQGHPLVCGAPVQMSDGGRTWLEVPLTTGERLLVDWRDGYSVIGAQGRVEQDPCD